MSRDPWFLRNLAPDAVLAGVVMNGSLRGAEAVRAQDQLVGSSRPLSAALTVSRLIGEALAGERDPDAFYRLAGQTYDDLVGYSDSHPREL